MIPAVRAALAAFLVAICLTGCSKEQLNELVDKTRQSVAQGTEKVQQTMKSATGTAQEHLNLAGDAQLWLDEPLRTQACYASWLQPGGSRPNVLQFRSYRDASQETYPSMLVQASVEAAGVTELAGQVVAAQMFLQPDRATTIWYTLPESPIQLRVQLVDDKTLAAEIVEGSLRNVQTGADHAITGRLTAVWQEPAMGAGATP